MRCLKLRECVIEGRGSHLGLTGSDARGGLISGFVFRGSDKGAVRINNWAGEGGKKKSENRGGDDDGDDDDEKTNVHRICDCDFVG